MASISAEVFQSLGGNAMNGLHVFKDKRGDMFKHTTFHIAANTVKVGVWKRLRVWTMEGRIIYWSAVQVDLSQVGFQIYGFGLCFKRWKN